MPNNNSSTNTVLLVIILLVIVGLGVWWFTMRSQPTQTQEVPTRNDAGLNLEINPPADNGSTGSNPNNP